MANHGVAKGGWVVKYSSFNWPQRGKRGWIIGPFFGRLLTITVERPVGSWCSPGGGGGPVSTPVEQAAVERVAEAMWAATSNTDLAWREIPVVVMNGYRDMARAAIEALQLPGEECLAVELAGLIYERSQMTQGDADDLAWDLLELLKGKAGEAL